MKLQALSPYGSLLCTFSLLLQACYTGVDLGTDANDPGHVGHDDGPADPLGAEEAFPGVPGTPATMYLSTPDGPVEVTYLHLNNGYGVLEGDIILYEPEDTAEGLPGPNNSGDVTYRLGALAEHAGDNSVDALRCDVNPQEGGVTARIGRRWLNREILWEFHPDVGEEIRTFVEDAIIDMEFAVEGLDFVPYSQVIHGPAADRIQVFQGEGCRSPVGRVGGRQRLTLSPICASAGTAIHEFSHAIGLWHEQSRQDRDQHVTVNLGNATAAHAHNFPKMPSDDRGAYNTASIMHYSSCAFARCSGPDDPMARCYNEGGTECGFGDAGCAHCSCADNGACLFPTILGPGGARIARQRTALEPSDVEALEFALGCPGGLNGDYCGGPVGFDEDILFTCNNGHYAFKQNCGDGTCIVAVPGFDDHCSNATICPSGDGWYCGQGVGLEQDRLYWCDDGVFHMTDPAPIHCAHDKCEIAPAGQNDHCIDESPQPPDPNAACAAGPCCENGAFRSEGSTCADDADSQYGCPWGTGAGADVGVQYRDRTCSGVSEACDGPYGDWEAWQTQEDCTNTEYCAPGDATCSDAPPVPDCAGGACCDPDGFFRPGGYVCGNDADSEFACPWGTSSGDDVGVRHRDQTCSGDSSACDGPYGVWGAWQTQDTCASDETCAPGDPNCSAAPCQETNYWDPPLATDIDNTGLQSKQSINVSLQMEVRQSANQLELRVCKLNDGLFQDDVKVAIYDAATNGEVGINTTLATDGTDCSGWIGMNNDESYQEGDVFGGIWNVVSPSTSAGDWDTWGTCSVSGDPTGTCWSGIGITLTRTCK